MSVGTNYIDLKWDAAFDNVNSVSYDIMNNNNNSIINVGNVLYYRFNGLVQNTLYSFKVRAYDAAGNISDWSNIIYQATTSADINKPKTMTTIIIE